MLCACVARIYSVFDVVVLCTSFSVASVHRAKTVGRTIKCSATPRSVKCCAWACDWVSGKRGLRRRGMEMAFKPDMDLRE